MRRISGYALAIAVAVVLHAANLRGQVIPRPCSEHTQLALNECAWQKYRTADAEMTRVYRSIIAGDPARSSLIASAQDAWALFRDAQCAYVAKGYEGGSMQPMQQGACLAALTRARTKQLREIAKW